MRLRRTIAKALVAGLLVPLVPVLAMADPASAAGTKTWTNASGDGLWTTDGNWSPAGMPAADDDVVVPAASGTGPRLAAGETASVRSLDLQAPMPLEGTLTVGPGPSTIDATITSTGAGAQLVNAGTMVFGVDGAFVGDGTLLNQSGATLGSSMPGSPTATLPIIFRLLNQGAVDLDAGLGIALIDPSGPGAYRVGPGSVLRTSGLVFDPGATITGGDSTSFVTLMPSILNGVPSTVPPGVLDTAAKVLHAGGSIAGPNRAGAFEVGGPVELTGGHLSLEPSAMVLVPRGTFTVAAGASVDAVTTRGGGTLRGAGHAGALVLDGGTTAPDGTLSATSLVVASPSTLAIDVTDDSTFDRVSVSGPAEVGGLGVTVVAAAGYTPPLGLTQRVLSAASRTGTPAPADLPEGYVGVLPDDTGLLLAAPTKAWNNATGDALWDTAGNWTPSGVPTASEFVAVPVGFAADAGPHVDSPVDVAGLALSSPLTLGSGQQLRLRTGRLAAEIVTGDGVEVLIDGPVLITGAFDETGGGLVHVTPGSHLRSNDVTPNPNTPPGNSTFGPLVNEGIVDARYVEVTGGLSGAGDYRTRSGTSWLVDGPSTLPEGSRVTGDGGLTITGTLAVADGVFAGPRLNLGRSVAGTPVPATATMTGANEVLGLGVGNGSLLTLGGDVTSAADSTIFGGGEIRLQSGSITSPGGAVLAGSGGRLTGSGTVAWLILQSGGIVDPDRSITASTVDLRDGSTLHVDVPNAADADRLVATSSATIGAATLEVDRAPGYTPAPGDAVRVLSAASRSGTFATVIGAAPFDVRYDATGAELVLPSLAPPAKDFGSVNVGEDSADQTFTLTNPGSTPLTVDGASITGADASSFRVRGGTCTAGPLTLEQDGSCTIEVDFAPTSAGAKGAQLEAGGLSAALSGTGVVPIPVSVWSGGGADDLWSNPANWVDGAVPIDGSEVTLPTGPTDRSTVLDYDVSVADLDAAADYTIAGDGVLTFPQAVGNALRIAAGATLTLGVDADLSFFFGDGVPDGTLVLAANTERPDVVLLGLGVVPRVVVTGTYPGTTLMYCVGTCEIAPAATIGSILEMKATVRLAGTVVGDLGNQSKDLLVGWPTATTGGSATVGGLLRLQNTFPSLATRVFADGTAHQVEAVGGFEAIGSITTLVLDLPAAFSGAAPQELILVATGGTAPIVGSVDVVEAPDGEDLDPAAIPIGSSTYRLTHTGGDGNDLALVLTDTTGPVITPTVDPATPASGWHTTDVGVSWSVVDDESAVTSTTGCGPTTVSADTDATGVSLTCSATSAGGTSSSTVTIKRDATAPTITGSVSPVAPGGSGWYTTAPTVSFECGDATPGSGVASCTAPSTLASSAAAQSVSGSAVDVAGNTGFATVSGLLVDTVAPSVVCPEGVTFTVGQAGSVTATVSDEHSGPAAPTVSAAADTSSVGTRSVDLTGTDVAGNATTESCSYSVSDASAPEVTATITPPTPLGGWHTTDVTVSWLVEDDESPVISTEGCGPTTITADTAGTTLTCTATSAGGTGTGTVIIKRDATDPTISGSVVPSSPDGTNGWYRTAPKVSFACADAPSDIATCTVPVTLSSSATPQEVTGTAVDNAGNTASTTVSGLKVDTVAPVVACPTVAPSFTVGQTGSVTATVSDEHSGPVSGTVSVPATTTAAGSFTASLTGTDQAGNTTTASCPYTVQKIATVLDAHPVLFRLSPWLSVQFPLTATLRDAAGQPIAGQVVRFSVGGRQVCTARTNSSGQASCSVVGISWLAALFNGGYTATYDGNATYLGSTDSAGLVG